MKQTSERLGVKIVGGLKEVNTPGRDHPSHRELRACSWFSMMLALPLTRLLPGLRSREGHPVHLAESPTTKLTVPWIPPW